MNIRGERIKCVSNLHAPELVVGKVYTAGESHTNTHGIWQVDVDGKWYAQVLFELTKEEEMKQQFYVGDKVKRVREFDEMHGGVCGKVYEVTGIRQDDGSNDLVLGGSSVRSASYYSIVERAWQKNTGEQPVEGDVEVEVKLRCAGEDKCIAGEFRWDFEDCTGDIVEWRLADSELSIESHPEDCVPPSHVAVGDELVANGVQQDLVNSPKHYAFFDGVQAIEIIASSMSVEAFRGYCMGNALKYRLRVGKKDKMEQEIAKADKYGELFEKHKHLCKGQ